MNPNHNMIPVRPGLNPPLYFQAYNAPPSGGFPLQQPPPSGQFILPNGGGVTGTFLPPPRQAMRFQTSTSMPYQTLQGQNIQYQQSNTQYTSSGSNPMGSYVPVVPISAPGYEQTSPLQRNSYSPNYSPINRSQVMVVSSQTPPTPEFRPVSPMSPMLQTGIRMTSPLNRSTSSPDTGKLEDSSKAPSAEDIFKAKASHHGINISTKSDKINEVTMRAFQFVESEKHKKQFEGEKKSVEENNTLAFMNKASKYGIKIEKPFKSPNKRTHSESESSDCASSAEIKAINGFLQEKWNECDEEKLNSNISNLSNTALNTSTCSNDTEKSGIEYSNILHALETKRNSKYEQMLTTLRRKSFANDDIDDLSTPELQSPRDDSTPNDWQNFNDIAARTSDSPYFSDVNSEEFNQPESKEEADNLAEITAAAQNIVDKVISTAIQEVRVEEIIQRGKEKKKQELLRSQSLYTWIRENQTAIEEHTQTLKNEKSETSSTRSNTPHSEVRSNTHHSEVRSNTPDSDVRSNTPHSDVRNHSEVRSNTPDSDVRSNTPHSDVRSNTPQSDIVEPNRVNSRCSNTANSTSDTIESDASELNPHSPEFKPSGFVYPKNGQHKQAKTLLKADVPEFIPSTIPLYVPKEETSNFQEYCEQDAENYDFYQYSKSPGITRETQTYTASVVEMATNTKRTKMHDKNIETKACDVRDIVINTVESMFDQEGDFYVGDNTEEVDHGHLDVYVQTDENQNSLKLNLINTQRELLRTRCYSCKQQLEAEKQKIRSSKYQIFTVFTQWEDRTAVNNVVESRVAFIDVEIIRLENMLLKYEKMLDEGVIFDKVPDFGTSWDLEDSNIRNLMTLESKEMQTDLSGDNTQDRPAPLEDDTHHKRFLTEAIKKILSKLDQHNCYPSELKEVLNEVKTFCKAVCDQLTNTTQQVENLKMGVKKLPAGRRTVETSSGGNSPLNVSPVKKSMSDKILVEKTEECNVLNIEPEEESKENIESKPKSKKAKKNKKKNRNEQEKSELPESVGNTVSESSSTCVQTENMDLSKVPSTQENVPESNKDSATNTINVPSIEFLENTSSNNTGSKETIFEASGLNANVNSSVALSKIYVSETTAGKTIHSLEDISDDDDSEDIDIKINLNKPEDNLVPNKSSQLPVQTAVPVNKDNKLSQMNTGSKSGISEQSLQECVQLKELKTADLSIPSCISKNSSETDIKVSESSQNKSVELELCTDTKPSETQAKSVGNQGVQGQTGLNSSYPALYEAVVQQLKQVYPQLASNPVMLNMVAAQQTAVLQMHIGKSASVGGSTSMQAGQSAAGGLAQLAAGGIAQSGLAQTAGGGLVQTAGGGLVQTAAGGLAQTAAGGLAQTLGGGLTNLMQSYGAAGMPQAIGVGMPNPLANLMNTNVPLQNQTNAKQIHSDSKVNYPSQVMKSTDKERVNDSNVDYPSQVMKTTDKERVNDSNVNYPSQVMKTTDKQSNCDRNANHPRQVMTSDKSTTGVSSASEKDTKSEKPKPFTAKNWLDNFPQASESGQKDEKNVNRSKSLKQQIDNYLSSKDTHTEQTVNKSLSSSIIGESTIKTDFGPPPGFGKQNDFSVDAVSSSSSSSTLVPSNSSSLTETLVPSNSSSFTDWAEERNQPKFDTQLTGVRSVRSPVKNSSAENVSQKPLKVPSSGFTFSKTLTNNLPPSSQPNDNSIKNVNNNAKMTSLGRQGINIPSLMSLPIPKKFRNESQPSITGVQGSFNGKLSGGDSYTNSEKKCQFPSNNSTYNGPSNLPPRIQKKRRSLENPPPVSSEPSWDDEVDDYAEPFKLKHDVRKHVDSYAPKSATAKLEDIYLPEKRKTEEENKEEENKDDDEDWCQVTKKKKKDSKPADVKKPANTTRARRPSTPGEKSSKSNNFERLVGMMSEIFTGLTRPQIIEVISDVRVVRGGLSGLTVKEIVEIARTVVIRKFEHKMTNNQRPIQPSDLVNRNSVMTDRRKQELQHIVAGYPAKPISTSNKFDVIETPEGRAEKMMAFNAMKAQQAASVLVGKSIDDEDDICVICHDELTFGDIKKLDCGHEFHSDCINKWVYERERTCPTCRGHALFVEDFPKLGS